MKNKQSGLNQLIQEYSSLEVFLEMLNFSKKKNNLMLIDYPRSTEQILEAPFVFTLIIPIFLTYQLL